MCDVKFVEIIKLDYMYKIMNLGFLVWVVREGFFLYGKVCYVGRVLFIVVGLDGKVYKCIVVFEDFRN